MDRLISDKYLKEREMDLELRSGLMEASMKDCGKTVKDLDMAELSFRMVVILMEAGSMTKRMEVEFFSIQTVPFIREKL